MKPVGDTILLTEDDSTDVLLFERAFRKAHLADRLEVVPDGEHAVAYLAGDGAYADRERYPLPWLVLLDIKLPRKSGLEVLAWLRQQPGLKHLPVVMLTSSGLAGDIGRAHEGGANAYHVKPASSEELLDLVRSLAVYSLTWSESPASDRRLRVGGDDDRMFPSSADQALSVRSKVYGLLSRHPDGLTPGALADVFLRLGLAVGEPPLVAARVEEILKDLEIGRRHPRVVRTEDGRYEARGLW